MPARKKFIYNNSSRKVQRRYLRSHATMAENILWAKIRKKQIWCIFRRQYRTNYFALNIRVVRIWNYEVLEDVDEVILRLKSLLLSRVEGE